MNEGSSAKEIVLGDELGDIAVKANGVRVEIHTDGSIVAYTKSDVDAYTNGAVHVHAAADDDDGKAMAAPKIGAVESTGEHKGEIYGGIYPADNKPIWFSQYAPELVNEFNAEGWARAQGGSLPSLKQGTYLNSLKDEGTFKELFNRIGSIWLYDGLPFLPSEDFARVQNLSDGNQHDRGRYAKELALCVRR